MPESFWASAVSAFFTFASSARASGVKASTCRERSSNSDPRAGSGMSFVGLWLFAVKDAAPDGFELS